MTLPLSTAGSTPAAPDPALDRQVFYLRAVAQIGRTLAAVGTLEGLLVQVADYFNEIAAVRWTCVYLRDPGTGEYRLRQRKVALADAGWTPPERVPAGALAGLREADAPAPAEAEAFGPSEAPRHVLPLFTEGAPTGFLLFGAKVAGGEIAGEERQFLRTLATQAALAIRHATTLDETARMAEEFALLNEISRLSTRGHDFAGNLREMWRLLKPFADLEEALLVPLAPDVEDVQLDGGGPAEGERERAKRWCELLLAERDRGGQLRRGEILLLEGSELRESFPDEFRPARVTGRTLAVLPLFVDEALAAFLVLRAPGGAERFRAHRRLLQNLSPTLSSALQKARDHEKLERLATTDGLTGLYNHRYFHDRLQLEYLRAYRLKDRVGLLLLDVDHFKSVNDAFGHVYGDQVLTQLAEVLRASVRQIDVPARYGGEEFAVILPQAACEEAVAVGERIRFAVEQTLPPRLDRRVRALTVSIGAAAYPESAPTKEKLVEAADRALYLAKRAGRNRVVAAGTEPAPAGPDRERGRP